jgi:hypothetical protein
MVSLRSRSLSRLYRDGRPGRPDCLSAIVLHDASIGAVRQRRLLHELLHARRFLLSRNPNHSPIVIGGGVASNNMSHSGEARTTASYRSP